jgi:hypothetical protein
MGTFRRSRLTDSGICRLYASGHSRREIALRAELYDAEVVAVLVANGMTLRTQEEARDLARASRKRHLGRLKLKGELSST